MLVVTKRFTNLNGSHSGMGAQQHCESPGNHETLLNQAI